VNNEPEKQLKLAEEALRAGAYDHALEILLSLKEKLEGKKFDDEAREFDRLNGLLKVLNNIGVVHKNRGMLEEACDYLNKALEISEKLGDDCIGMRTGILSNLGLLYSRLKKYAEGNQAFEEALRLAIRYPDRVGSRLRIKIHNNRALFFVRFGEPDKAREELARSLEAGQDKSSDNAGEREAWLTANLGMIHAELGQEEIYNPNRQEELFRQARSMFLRSAELYGRQGYVLNRLRQLINVAEIEIRLGAFEEARFRLDEAAREAERRRDSRLLCDIRHVFVELAISTGERDQVVSAVKDALQAFKECSQADLPIRKAKLESVLRRTGFGEVLDLLIDIKTPKESERNHKERTRN